MVKKVVYGSVLGILGTESYVIGSRIYELVKSGVMISSGGIPIAPYWLVVEGSMVLLLPIFIKIFKFTNKGGIIADDSKLTEMIKKYHEGE
jgi:hypothetical protein